jgi:hypothetical protein
MFSAPPPPLVVALMFMGSFLYSTIEIWMTCCKGIFHVDHWQIVEVWNAIYLVLNPFILLYVFVGFIRFYSIFYLYFIHYSWEFARKNLVVCVVVAVQYNENFCTFIYVFSYGISSHWYFRLWGIYIYILARYP